MANKVNHSIGGFKPLDKVGIQRAIGLERIQAQKPHSEASTMLAEDVTSEVVGDTSAGHCDGGDDSKQVRYAHLCPLFLHILSSYLSLYALPSGVFALLLIEITPSFSIIMYSEVRRLAAPA